MIRLGLAASFAAVFIWGGVFGELNRPWTFGLSAFADEAVTLGEVVVSATPDSSPEKPSGFVTILKPTTSEKQVKTLTEILSEQPGVNVQQFGGLGQFSTVTLRGSTSEQVTVLIDGMKINTAQGGAVDFSNLPLDAIDHIEIVRGGASAQFGSDAMGGAIHIITKGVKKKQTIEASVGGGSFTTLKTNEGYSRKFKRGSILFNHTHLQSEGDFGFKSTATSIGGVTLGGGKTYTRENNAFLSENGLIKASFDPTEKIHLSLTTDGFGSRREVAPTEDEFILLSPANPPEAKETLFKNYTTLRADFDSVGASSLSLFVQPYYRYDFSHFTDPSPALGGAIDVKSFNRSIGGKIGGDYFLKKNLVDQGLKLIYEIKEDLFHDENLAGGSASGSHHRTTQAIFFSDELSWLDERLLLNPSVRFEHTNDFGTHTALHLGIKGQPLSWLTAKANIENSFRYPNFSELFFPDQGIIRGNPLLMSEKAINFDVGLQFQHRYGTHEIGYFLNRIDNSIVFVPISAFTIAPINTRQVHTQGFEVSTSLAPLSYLEIDANYTYLSARLVDSGNQLPGRPKHKANLKVGLKNKWGSVYGRLQYIDDLPIDFQNTTFLRKRAQVDLGAAVQFLKHYYFAVEAKNITHIQMLDAQGFPLPRFSVFASLGVKI